MSVVKVCAYIIIIYIYSNIHNNNNTIPKVVLPGVLKKENVYIYVIMK